MRKSVTGILEMLGPGSRATVAESLSDASPIQSSLGNARAGEWDELLRQRSHVLVVCSVSRSAPDVLNMLWLLDAGIAIVLVDHCDRQRAEDAITRLGATHWYQNGVLRSLGTRRSVPAHVERRIVLPTSGSSGIPRYVSLSAMAVLQNAAAVGRSIGLADDDIGVTTLGPAYSFGLSNVLAHVLVGASVISCEVSVTSGDFWAAMRDVGATSLAFAASSAPVVLAALRRSLMPPTLRRVMFAGGAVSSHLLPDLYEHAARAGVSVHLMYGQTEAGPRIAISDPSVESTAWGTVGRAIDGVSTRIVDGYGHVLPDGTEGRIQVRSRYVMSGYIHSADDLATPCETISWLDTGDCGRRDNAGRLWISGRVDDVRKVSGFRVNIGDIRVVAERTFNLPAAVVTKPDSVVVCIETEVAVCGDDPRVASIAAYAGVPSRLLRVVITKKLPRGANGKIDRALLAERMSNTDAGVKNDEYA